MFLKNKMIRRCVLAFIIFSLILSSVLVYLSLQPILNEDSKLQQAAKLISKSFIMRIFDQYERLMGDAQYAPTPFDSKDFTYADLSSQNFEKITIDKRLVHFYSGNSLPIDFQDAVSMANFLRGLFQHGFPQKNYLYADVLEMLDAAEEGEKFLCGNISMMLAQMIQAGGTQARTVGLYDEQYNGHVVVEIWSRKFNKWAVVDPDYNIHYTNNSNIPLSAVELYKFAREEKVDEVKRNVGNSPNTLHKSNTNLIDRFYRNGFIIDFYNKWIDANLPRRHPARSPAIMGYYVGDSWLRRIYNKHFSRTLNDDIVAILYANP